MRLKKRSFTLFSRQLHASIAYLMALIFMWFTLSGWLLHHTEDFKLNDIKLNQTWLLKWYDITPPKIEQVFPIETSTQNPVKAVKTNHGLYLGGEKLTLTEPIQTVYSTEFLSFVVLTSSLVISTHQGELIEVLLLPNDFAHALKDNVSNLRFYSFGDNQYVWVLNGAGWLLTSDLARIKKQTLSGLDLNRNILPLEPFSSDAISSLDPNAYFESPLSLETLVLDVHNGYFWGNAGKWLVDVSAALILIMLVSGLSIKIRKKNSRKHS